MALRRIEFTPEFITHLGLHGIAPGIRAVDDASAFEPPADLRRAYVWDAPVEIGAFTYLGPDVFCTAARLGRYCSVAKLVQIGLSTHPADRLTSSPLSLEALRAVRIAFPERGSGLGAQATYRALRRASGHDDRQ